MPTHAISLLRTLRKVPTNSSNRTGDRREAQMSTAQLEAVSASVGCRTRVYGLLPHQGCTMALVFLVTPPRSGQGKFAMYVPCRSLMAFQRGPTGLWSFW